MVMVEVAIGFIVTATLFWFTGNVLSLVAAMLTGGLLVWALVVWLLSW